MRKPKFKKKYLITFVILGIAIYFNWKEIPIQPEFVDVVKWLMLGIFGGFATKSAKEAFQNRNK